MAYVLPLILLAGLFLCGVGWGLLVIETIEYWWDHWRESR